MAAAVLGAAATFVPALAAAGATHDVPTVVVEPAPANPSGPDHGVWFVYQVAAGRSATAQVRLTNPARVPQTVHLYARDLDVRSNGTVQVLDRTGRDVGAWTTLGVTDVSLGPLAHATVPLHIDVPADAEPGDHVGALVAEATPYAVGNVRVVKRVATRIYVTVPGVAVRSLRVAAVRHAVVGRLWPRRLQVRADVANTGRIRLAPDVRIAGHRATGSPVVVAGTVEPYAAAVHVPWWGGRVHVPVTADAGGGLVVTRHVAVLVVPWLLVAIAVVTIVAAAFGCGVVVLRRRRASAERRALEDRIRELESRVPVTQ